MNPQDGLSAHKTAAPHVVPVASETCQQAKRRPDQPAESGATMDLAELLKRWGKSCQPHGPLVSPETPGFSGAIVRRVESERGPLALRGWPAAGLPRQRLEGLHRLLAHVAPRTPVAVPLASLDGRSLVAFAGRLWQLEPWLPGQADFHEHPSVERLDAAIRCLAGFHQAAATFSSDGVHGDWFYLATAARSPATGERRERVDRFSHNWTMLCGQAHSRGRLGTAVEQISDLFPRAVDRIRDELTTATRQEFDLQPCLRDIWHDNLLFCGEVVSGVIDASACRAENVATDLARLIGSLVGDDHDRWARALAVYQQTNPLDPGEQALVGILDRSGVLLAAAVWLERIATGLVTDPVPPSIATRVGDVVRRLETLVEAS